VLENTVLRRIFGLKRVEVTGEWRKLHNEELHDLYSSPSIIRIFKSRSPHAILPSYHEKWFSINICTSICDDNSFRLTCLQGRFTKRSSKTICVICWLMWYLLIVENCTSCITVLLIIGTWIVKFPSTCKSRDGSIAWPARSPDLNSLDSTCGGPFKIVHVFNSSDDVETLRNQIMAGFHNMSGIWDHLQVAMRRWTRHVFVQKVMWRAECHRP
jgi:hypothetical protein